MRWGAHDGMRSGIEHLKHRLSKSRAKTTTRSLHGSQGTPEATMPLALYKGRLILEDGQCFLQSLDLCLAPSLARGISLRLGNAPILDLAVVIHDCSVLCVSGVEIPGVLGHSVVLSLRLLRLVLHILILGGFGHGVLLRDLLVFGLSICLLRLLLGQVGGEIGLAHLQDVDDALACSLRLGMQLRFRWLLHESTELGLV